MNLNEKIIAGDHKLSALKTSSFLMKTNDVICSAVSKALIFVSQTATTGSFDDGALAKTVSSVEINVSVDQAEKESVPVIPLDEVFWHDKICDCWIVVYDRVYNITEFLQEHPGGEEVLLDYAGRDATIAFNGVGHSLQALRALDKYLVGVLPEHERIYTRGSLKIFDSFASSLSLGT